MKLPSLIVVLFLLYPGFSYGQIISQIKTESNNHVSSSSSSSGSSSSSSSSNDDYSTSEDYSTETYYNEPAYIPPTNNTNFYPDFRPYRKPRDPNRKYNYLSLMYRKTVDSRKVIVSVPEMQINLSGYYIGLRVNKLFEPRAREDDDYTTVDLQFLGFQTNPEGTAVFNLSTGILSESYSHKTYMESVAGLKVKLGNKLLIFGEGRFCQNKGIRIRTEGTLGVDYTVVTTDWVAIAANAFFTSALYYEKVPIEGFGLGFSVRF